MKQVYFPFSIFLFCSFVFIAKSQAQDCLWVNTVDGTPFQEGYDIAVDNDGNVYAAGITQATVVDFDPTDGEFLVDGLGQGDGYLVKYDAAGNFIWGKVVGTSGGDQINAVDTDDDGNVIVVGRTNNFLIQKFTSSGDLVFALAYPSAPFNHCDDVGTDADGNIYISGVYSGNPDFDPGDGEAFLTPWGGGDIFLMKLSADGIFQWVNTIGGPDTADIGYGIAVDDDGNSFLTGMYFQGLDLDPTDVNTNFTVNGYSDAFIAKYDTNGNYEWGRTFGGAFYEYAHDIRLDSQGNLLVVGYFIGESDFDPSENEFMLTSAGDNGTADVFFAKYSDVGDLIWANSVGSINADWGWGISTDSDDNVYVLGYFSTICDFDPSADIFEVTGFGGSNDIFVAKYDASGSFIWVATAGSSSEERAFDVEVSDSGVYAIGSIFNFVDFEDGPGEIIAGTTNWMSGYLAKFSLTSSPNAVEEGELTSSTVYPNPAHHRVLIDGIHEKANVAMFNMQGQIVLQKSVSKSKVLDVSSLSPGLYTLSISEADQSRLIKIVIE